MTTAEGILIIVSCVGLLWIGLFVDTTKGLVWNLRENWPPLAMMLLIAGVILGIGA